MERSAEQELCSQQLRALGICIIVPTYNNERTIARVLEEVLHYADDVIVVNDGATDTTQQILSSFADRITVITYAPNKGKGFAMRQGFAKALELKFKHALTMDSDGQHYPSDIPRFVEAHQEHPRTFLMGSRNLNAEGMPSKNSFANKFSNFWFFIETGIRLPDTQTGFRLYPLKRVEKLWLFTNRFEFEVEVIVKLAWVGMPFMPVPIQVKYDPNERVSHFRPGPDFTRISFLNAYLCILTFLYYLPKRLLSGGKILKMIRDEAINPNESNLRKSASIGLGVFFGTLPIWGFQLLTGIPTAIFLRLNKVLFIAAANVSVPPMIPVIIYLSYKLGSAITGTDTLQFDNISELSLANIHDNFVQYFAGGVLLALAGGLTSFLLSWGIFALGRKKGK
jgi:glycosyltransferase involved in cell wall biosynthesis